MADGEGGRNVERQCGGDGSVDEAGRDGAFVAVDEVNDSILVFKNGYESRYAGIVGFETGRRKEERCFGGEAGHVSRLSP